MQKKKRKIYNVKKFNYEDKYFEALDFIKRQNYDIISSS